MKTLLLVLAATFAQPANQSPLYIAQSCAAFDLRLDSKGLEYLKTHPWRIEPQVSDYTLDPTTICIDDSLVRISLDGQVIVTVSRVIVAPR